MKELVDLSQRPPSTVIFKFLKCTEFAKSQVLLGNQKDYNFIDLLFRAILILHENIYIYRRACIDKIPTLGQFFHGQMGIFQILLSHSSKIQYIGQNQVVLHFFKVTNWHILIFLRLLGSNKGSLKCTAKSKFFDES